MVFQKVFVVLCQIAQALGILLVYKKMLNNNQNCHSTFFISLVPSKLHTVKTNIIIQTYHCFGYALDLLVTVSSMCYHTSTSALSTSSSSRGLTNLRYGISHLEGGFTLRCLQRLSLPGLATLLCLW